ncbi:MAG: valine--tRNA ligase [Planctomycetota bacterium]|nr:valine--tRNA ligase [Planctomycetota bacterium]
MTEFWDANQFFHSQPNPDRKPFSVVIPPPNVTGALHLGHALNNTLQDIKVRMKRMQGFETCWMPGTDHAGIATQAVVEKRLKENEGLTRHDMENPRQELVERIWEWKKEYEARILGQLKQMGCSCDWKRTRFTLDEGCSRAVRETFFDLFSKQRIYRGKRLVNWDTGLKTAVSDDEVVNKKTQGNFWHLRYPVIEPAEGEPTHITIATTRPETMLGDTAVAVHPNPARAFDKLEKEAIEKLNKASEKEKPACQEQLENIRQRRESMLAELEQLRDMANDGRMIHLPLVDRPIPLVADEWAKPEMGSGCVKITPAHDPNDYQVGQRCQLPMINIMNRDGTLNGEAGSYEGLTMKEGRTRIVTDMEELGLLENVEEREIELPHSDRSKKPIEPFLADQWFVRMDELAQSAIDAVESNQVQIFPERYRKGYIDWLSEKRDWPVSRQLYWGHQIPVWSRCCETQEELDEVTRELEGPLLVNGTTAAWQVEYSEEPDEAKRKSLEIPFAVVHICIRKEGDALENLVEDAGFEREADVLDTWFSSALWPHSTFGWPEKTADLEYYYPTSALITSRDIITLWVARMVLAGLNNLDRIPFHEVFIHPKILDGNGETMSKSKGNGVDPLDVISKLGADALRFGMAQLATETQDVRMPVQFECPHCEAKIKQTVKNRELAVIRCPHCEQDFSTQWARTAEEKSIRRGPLLSERFESARNFVNKLWNASRFALTNLPGYLEAAVTDDQLETEDRWILSRLSTVTSGVSQALDRYQYAEAARLLYEFAWDDFCSYYVEMLKDRFQEEGKKPVAQRMLANTLDALLKLLAPILPFVTEEIWRLLNEMAPVRGMSEPVEAAPSITIAPWPVLDESSIDPSIEKQFALFQKILGSVRNVRSQQNIPPREKVEFVIRTHAGIAALVEPLAGYFQSLSQSELLGIGEAVAIPSTNATVSLPDIEIYVDLEKFIDKEAELQRLQKEESRTAGLIQSKEKKLSNANFVDRAPAEVVQKERESLDQLHEQQKTLVTAIEKLKNSIG